MAACTRGPTKDTNHVDTADFLLADSKVTMVQENEGNLGAILKIMDRAACLSAEVRGWLLITRAHRIHPCRPGCSLQCSSLAVLSLSSSHRRMSPVYAFNGAQSRVPVSRGCSDLMRSTLNLTVVTNTKHRFWHKPRA
jgi:hypothetical protein